MTKEMESAIIGCWRCGASMEHIMWATQTSYWLVKSVIDDYQKTLLP